MALKVFQNAAASDESGSEWVGEEFVRVSNDQGAEYNDTTQAFLRVTDWGLDLPDNAIIRGIEVSIEGFGDNAAGAERTIEVTLTKDGVNGMGVAKTLELAQSSDTTQRLGGATDLWEAADDMVISSVNASTFGIRIRKNTATGNRIVIDHVMLRVYYDFGVRGEWDFDFDNQELTHIDGYLSYDGGSGLPIPVDGDVVRGAAGAIGTIIGTGEVNTQVFGDVIMGDVEGTYVDDEALTLMEWIDFDTESNGGFTPFDVGSTVTGALSSRTGTIRRVVSYGASGRLWGLFAGGSGNFTGGEALQISGQTRALASNGGSGDRTWAGAVNLALIEQTQGYLDYDGETVSFEASSGLERIRDRLGFLHNMCLYGSTSLASAMVVDDREDPNATDTGRMFMIDVTGTFQDDEPLEALEELDYTNEQGGGAKVGQTITGATSTETGIIRRIIRNGTSGTFYLSDVSGAFSSGENLQVAASTRAVAATTTTPAFHRRRVGTAVANGTFTALDAQWPGSHVYSDGQDQFQQLNQLDDTVPLSAQVLDQQYTAINGWELPFLSTRFLKSGSIKELDLVGGSDDDTIFTNYQSVGSQAGNPAVYIEQLVAGATRVLNQFWDNGPINILVRNKHKNVRINNGTVTAYAREFGYTYDHFETSTVGGVAVIPLSTASDADNQTAEATVQTTAVYHAIEFAWASHTLDFDTGTGGTFEVCDVLYNSTRSQGVIVARVPDSFDSGIDLHIGTHGQTITAWGDGDSLEVLDYVDFDGQVSQFSIGDVVEAGGGGSGGPTACTIRWVQQFGASRGRIWFSDQAGGDWTNDENIRPDGGGATIATCSAAQVSRAGWTGLTNGADPETADTTVLKDIGQGGDQPYNLVAKLNAATVAQWYEMAKYLTRRLAGSTTDPGSLLYPDNTSREGRLYQKAASTYGAADLKKPSPLGTFAGGKFFGARGVFIEDMASADIQNYELIDANGTTRNPPNLQAVTVSGLVIGDSVSVHKRSSYTRSDYTFNDDDGSGNSTVATAAGDFVDEGFKVGDVITVVGGTNDGNTGTITAVTTTLITVSGVVFTDDTPGSTTITADNVNEDEFSGAASGNDLGDGDFVVLESLPTDLPSSGTLVVVHKDGSEIYEDILAYSSYTGSTFTLSGTLPRTYDGDARAYVPLLLKVATATSESQQIVYSADFPIKTRVRLKGILPFEVDGTFSSSGASVQAIRTNDPIVE